MKKALSLPLVFVLLFFIVSSAFASTDTLVDTERRGIAEYLELFTIRAEAISEYYGTQYTPSSFTFPAQIFADGYIVTSSGGTLQISDVDLSVEWVMTDLMDFQIDADANAKLFAKCSAVISALEYTVLDDQRIALESQYGINADGDAALAAMKIFNSEINAAVKDYIMKSKTEEVLAYSGNYDYYIKSGTVEFSDGKHEVLYLIAKAR